ncbi:MAG: fimbrillin family protein [Tannerellaceae bacterium]|nr:fimbrillin family protein [Tannerellaceae bacterium]
MKNKRKIANRTLSIVNCQLSIAFVFLLAFVSCSQQEEVPEITQERVLRIAPSIGDLTEPVSKGPANNFFEEGDEILVTIRTSGANSTEEEFTYVYGGDGIFTGNPPYRFPLDDSYVQELTAVWPVDVEETGGFVADQREYQDYRRADWLVASATASGIMATDIPVPLYFEHNNCLLEFELAGQNTSGLAIKELLLELEVEGTPTACWAYCDNADGRASFLLKDGTVLQSNGEILLGTLIGSSDIRYTIILSEIDMVLEAGKRYLVTLTPKGYDMDIYVFIGTFSTPDGERETGIAVPFELPDEGEDGTYILRTPVQLVTASYVVRHYTDGRTPDFPAATYVLTSDFEMTAEVAEKYIPIPRTLFTGQFILNGEVIESLPYGDGEVLELFTNE